MIRKPLVLPFLVLLLVPRLAAGWGNQGHEITCAIAWREMSPNARKFVADTLGGEESAVAFARACTWPDSPAVRNNAAYAWADPQHFINIEPGGHLDGSKQCPAKGCIVRAIGQQARLTLDASSSSDLRRQALEFLGHFVGDVHQPLHAGYPGDLGGNTIKTHICTDGCESWTLHKVWDRSLVEIDDRSSQEIASELASHITDAERARWKTADTRAWVEESFALAESRAYRPVSGGKVVDGYIGDGASPVELGTEYVEVMRPVVVEQLEKGGVRLAFVLDAMASGQVPAELASIKPLEVTAKSGPVWVHAGPHSADARIGVLELNHSAELIGAGKDRWYRVRLADGRQGFLYGTRVKVEG